MTTDTRAAVGLVLAVSLSVLARGSVWAWIAAAGAALAAIESVPTCWPPRRRTP